MIYNYYISVGEFVDSSVLIDNVSRPYWVEDQENQIYDVYYAFSGRAIDHIEFTIDSNVEIYNVHASIEIVALTGMGANYFAFHLRTPWYRYVTEEGEPDTMILKFNGSIYTDNPYYTRPFRFRIDVEGCEKMVYYQITYNSNGAESGTEPIDDFYYIPGDTGVVLENSGDLQREDSDFLGWNTEPNGGGTTYMPGDTISVDDNITLFAMWGELPILVLTSHEDGGEVRLKRLSRNQSSLEYSINKGNTWAQLTLDDNISLDSGKTVYLKGILNGENTEQEYFVYTSISNNGYIRLTRTNDNAASLEYSVDDTTTWHTLSVSMQSTGETLYVSSEQTIYIRNISANGRLETNGMDKYNSEYTNFGLTGNISASRYMNAMWNYNNLDEPLNAFCAYKLFADNTGLTDASELIMSTEDLGEAINCYDAMFSGCTNLTYGPNLPATALSNYCYKNMFRGCINLSETPSLESQSVSVGCYYYMFAGCSNLTNDTIPSRLPAMEVKAYSYQGMFAGCTGLTKSIQLPAMSLADYCYANMFQGCTSLEDASGDNGELDLMATRLYWGCYQYMFENCRNLTKVQEILPSNNQLGVNCYQYMYCNCKSLDHGPYLPSTYLPGGNSDSYGYMFAYCDNLDNIDMLPSRIDSVGRGNMKGMFKGCNSLVRIDRELYFGSTQSQGTAWMFQNCQNLEYIKDVKLTFDGNSSINAQQMFSGCIKLEECPIHDIISNGGSGAFYYMFDGCVKMSGSTPWLGRFDYFGYRNPTYMIGMFKNCKQITKTKGYLTPSDLVGYLNGWWEGASMYAEMFYGCENLTELGAFFNEDPTDANYEIIQRRQLSNWLFGVPSGADAIASGCTFYQSWDAVWDSTVLRGPSTVPEGWTIVSALYYVSRVDLSGIPALSSVELIDASGNTHTGNISNDYCRYDSEHQEGVLAYETQIDGENRYDLKIKSFNNSILENNTNVIWFYIPETCTEVPERAFYGCNSLERTEIGRGVKTIREYAYYNCSGINDWRQILSQYDQYMLPLCTLINVPDNIENIEQYAFYNCTGLPLQFTANSRIETIGSNAFVNCNGRIELYLPSCLTQIGANAFKNCSNISAITINNLSATVDSTAFDGVNYNNHVGIVYYPSGEPYQNTDYYATALGNWTWEEIPEETN